MDKKLVKEHLLLKIRLLTLFFMAALIVSGVTAFPVETELRLLTGLLDMFPDNASAAFIAFNDWIRQVYSGIQEINRATPFIFYGTDWLAFAHIVIALAFIGLYREPVRNKWLVSWGIICCLAIIPLAMICGAVRQIPFFWRLIDCSFGVFGLVPLLLIKRMIQNLETNFNTTENGTVRYA